MGTDIDRDQALPIDQHLQRDPVAEVDRHRMQTLQASPQGMEPQRKVVQIGLQQQQRLAVALAQIRMAAQEASGPAFIALGENQRPAWLPDTCRLRQSCDNQRCAVAWLWR